MFMRGPSCWGWGRWSTPASRPPIASSPGPAGHGVGCAGGGSTGRGDGRGRRPAPVGAERRERDRRSRYRRLDRHRGPGCRYRSRPTMAARKKSTAAGWRSSSSRRLVVTGKPPSTIELSRPSETQTSSDLAAVTGCVRRPSPSHLRSEWEYRAAIRSAWVSECERYSVHPYSVHPQRMGEVTEPTYATLATFRLDLTREAEQRRASDSIPASSLELGPWTETLPKASSCSRTRPGARPSR